MDDTQLEPESPTDTKTAAVIWKTAFGNGIEVNYDPIYWPDESLNQFGQLAARLLDHINGELSLDGIVIGLLLCSDDRMRELNRRFRGDDRATNVLSFPQLDDDLFRDDVLATTELPTLHFFGEIAIARETATTQAGELGIEINDHLAHLFVHGLMHLLGYDHEIDQEANEMEAIEVAILAAFSIANPYLITERARNHGLIV